MSTAQDLWCVRQDISQHKLDTAFLRYSIPQIQPKSGRNSVLPGCGDQNRSLWREDTRRDGVGSTVQNTEVTREGKKHLNSIHFQPFYIYFISLFVLLPPMTGHCLFNTGFMKYKLHSLFFFLYQIGVQVGNINLEFSYQLEILRGQISISLNKHSKVVIGKHR